MDDDDDDDITNNKSGKRSNRIPFHPLDVGRPPRPVMLVKLLTDRAVVLLSHSMICNPFYSGRNASQVHD